MQDGAIKIINRLLDRVDKLETDIQQTGKAAYANVQAYRIELDKLTSERNALAAELDRVVRLPVEEYRQWVSKRIGDGIPF